METLLETYLEKRTVKEAPKNLLVPWLNHPGKALDKEIDTLIEPPESKEVTPKNEVDA
jgi:hypothetical protein